MKSTEVLKDEAYGLIEEEEFDKAKKTIEEALNNAPKDITVLELYDYWYDANGNLEEKERLLGRLKIIDKMLKLHPSGTNDVFEAADYYPDLHHVRIDLLSRLAEETLDINILKQVLDGYDALIEKEGIDDYPHAANRLALLNLVIDRINREEAQKIIGDLTVLRLKYMDDLVLSGDYEGLVKKGDYLIELGRYEEAISSYEKNINFYEKTFNSVETILKNKPEHYIRYLKIAKCQLQLKNYNGALEACDNIPASYKYASDKPYIQAKALAGLKRFDEALEKLKNYSSEHKEIAVKAKMRTDTDFMELWNTKTFLDITFAPGLDLDAINRKQEELRDQKNK